MKKTKIRKLLKPAAFMLILGLVFAATFRVLWLKEEAHTTTIMRFYDLPENSVDAILIGSSAVSEYYIAAEAYHHNGLVSYPLSTGNQPFGAIRYLMEEARKTQNPRVFVVDIRMLLTEQYTEEEIRRVTDGMKFTGTRLRLIDSLLPYYQETHPDTRVNWADYVFSFRKYHSRWQDITFSDLVPDEKLCLGYVVSTTIQSYKPVKPEVITAEPQSLPEHNEKMLRELLSYCRENSTPVLFIDVPSVFKKEQFAQLNAAKQIIAAEGFEVLEMNELMGEIRLDYGCDFKSYNHINTYGGLKFTDYLADYLAAHYGRSTPDPDPKTYEKWTESYERFSAQLLAATGRSDKYFEILPRYENCTIAVATKGDASKNIWRETLEAMQALGLDPVLPDWADRRYAAVISGGLKCFEETGNTPSFAGETAGKKLSVSTGDEGCSISLDGQELAVNQRGLNVVVIDNATGRCLDSVCFDTGGDGKTTHAE